MAAVQARDLRVPVTGLAVSLQGGCCRRRGSCLKLHVLTACSHPSRAAPGGSEYYLLGRASDEPRKARRKGPGRWRVRTKKGSDWSATEVGRFRCSARSSV